MRLRVTHTTSYTYSAPVTLSPHYLRFRPQQRDYFALDGFDLTINPEPNSISERLDAENNPVSQIWLDPVPVESIDISMEMTVTLHPFDPFHFLLDPPVKCMDNRFYYPDEFQEFLSPYLAVNASENQPFYLYLNNKVKGCDKSCILFITGLIRDIHNQFTYESKEEGVLLNAGTIFDNQSGSCKELAWMVIQMLRQVGLASRFVSGYAYNPILGDGHELHAWVEVLLPGAGWIGLDPSSGLLTDEHYLPVATSFHPDNTMPVTGKFRGEATASLTANVHIEEI